MHHSRQTPEGQGDAGLWDETWMMSEFALHKIWAFNVLCISGVFCSLEQCRNTYPLSLNVAKNLTFANICKIMHHNVNTDLYFWEILKKTIIVHRKKISRTLTCWQENMKYPWGQTASMKRETWSVTNFKKVGSLVSKWAENIHWNYVEELDHNFNLQCNGWTLSETTKHL